MVTKELLGLTAIAIDFGSIVPYIRAIMAGHKKPHVFTWIIWGLTTSVIFFSQLSENAGAGAWVTGFSACLCFVIVGLSLWKNPGLQITRLDWVFFTGALCSIPLWYVTSNPLWAVILLCAIDVMGYVPTLRKAYVLPQEESVFLFAIQILKNCLTISALEVYTVSTVLFSLTVSIMNIAVLLCIFMGYRKN